MIDIFLARNTGYIICTPNGMPWETFYPTSNFKILTPPLTLISGWKFLKSGSN